MTTDPGRITAEALICRYAELNDGGLTIIGAGGTRVAIAPRKPHSINLWLALLVHVPYTRTNEDHTVSVELVLDMPTEEGPVQRVPINLREQSHLEEKQRGKVYAGINVGRPAMMKPGEETLVPFAIPVLNREIPGPGHYYFIVRVDTTNVVARASFEIDVVQVVSILG